MSSNHDCTLFIIGLFYTLSSLSTCMGEKVYMNQFAVHINGNSEAADKIADKHGFNNLGQIGSLEGFYLFEHNHISKRSIERSQEHHSKLATEPDVRWVEQQFHHKRVKRDLLYHPRESRGVNVQGPQYVQTPFRPVVYNGQFPDPLYSEQWYLHHGAVDGWDMNVLGAWRKGYTGKGVVVSILDDGIQTNHPDLIKNYDPLASADINGNDDDPMPQDNGDNKHGTRCAGEVAAMAFNNICGVGIAFNSSIGGVRMLDGTVNDAVEAKALSLNRNHIDVYSASWGPEDDGKTVDGPGPMARRAFIEGVTQGRRRKGSIFVWASGNGGRHTDNCNCDGYTNSIFTLSISSVTQRGYKPWYLEECSSTLATTYSSGTPGHDKNIVTVDMDASLDPRSLCTRDHTGTSASAPIAAAICALALEANPGLSWRDMQYLVMLTSRPEPLEKEEGWTFNGVNRKVSHKFGYGLMDAAAMVTLAEQWTPVPIQHVCETPEDLYQRLIPKEFGGNLEIYMNTDACWNTQNVVNYLEHVQCKITLRYNPRGNLKIMLESPQGTRSVLLFPRPRDVYQTDFQDWPFLSVHFWGEKAAGRWKLSISNAGSTNVPEPGILKKWSLVFHGTEQDPISIRSPLSDRYQFAASDTSKAGMTVLQTREDQQLEDCHRECHGGCYGNGPEKCKACRHFQTDFEPRLCVDACTEGQFADTNNTCRQCHQSCKTCTAAESTNCMSCAEGLLFIEGANECKKMCPSGYYAHDAHKTCFPCSASCNDCFGKADNCSSCKPGLVAYRSSCMAGCPKKTYEGGNHRCLSCNELCETCMGPKSTDCVTCPSNFVHLNGTCLEVCPHGYYTDGIINECYSCDPSCSTCNATHCLSCRSGWTLDPSGRCQLPNECDKGQYRNGDRCLQCHLSCSTCEGPAYSQCLSCPENFFVFKSTCLKQCPSNAFLSDPRECLPCHETCSTCNGSEANHCTSCLSHLQLRGTVCSTTCGDKMFADEGHCQSCHQSCLTCSGPKASDCLTCPQNLQLGNGKCQESCPIGFFPDNSTCRPCFHTCMNCKGDGLQDCVSCHDNLVLDSGFCMECSQGQFYDAIAQQCKPCEPSCTTCSGPDSYSCLTCTQPLKHDPVYHRCVPCCTTQNHDSCCHCDIRTDTCISQPSTDKRRIMEFKPIPKKTVVPAPFPYSMFALAAVSTCIAAIVFSLVGYKLFASRASDRCCRSKGYQRLPMRYEALIDSVELSREDLWDDNDEVKT